jgi:peptidoglycan hydrolase-like protein with peptidoglycan-binding domain
MRSVLRLEAFGPQTLSVGVMLLRFSMAFALAASLAGAAHAYSPAQGPDILSELPTDAPPGVCYARVKVPGEPAGPPPVMMGAQWVLNPGPPGSPGPIWCLVPTGPAPVAVAPAAERYGWIRVLCDDDATPERIRGVQRRLHERGYYRGQVTGRYDAATAAAVGQFQSNAHIGHGGYLSLQTLDVLESQGGYSAPAPVYAGGYAGQQGYQQSYQQSGGYSVSEGYGPSPCLQTCAYQAPPAPPPVYYQPPPCCQQPAYQQPVYQQPVYQPPCCQQPVYAPPPCCAAAQAYQSTSYGYYAGSPTPAYAAASASASARAYAGGGRASASASAYASSTSAVQNGWLTWGGMSRY